MSRSELDAGVRVRVERPPREESRRITLAFAAIAFGTVLSAWNITLIAPALPEIVRQFGAQGRYAWVVLALAVPATVILPVAGKLSDAYGPKRFYIASISIFLAGSLTAALAPDFVSLVVARVIQGVGLGGMQAVAQTILGELVAPRHRGKYIGILSGAYGAATVAGPLLGGAITDHMGWRWLFMANLPIALANIAAAGAWIRLAPRRRVRSIDVPGVVALSASVLAFVFALSASGQLLAWDSPQLVLLLGVAVVCAAIFVALERRSRVPVLPLGLLTTKAFALPNVTMLGVAAAMYGAIYFIPLFAQTVLHLSATQSGSLLAPLLISLIVVSIIVGQIVSRTGNYRRLLVSGVALVAVGFVLCGYMDESTQLWQMVASMAVLGVGLGAAMPTLTVAAQSAAPVTDVGIATATIMFSRSIGTVLGVAVMGAVFSGTGSMGATFGVALPLLAVALLSAATSPTVSLRSHAIAVDAEGG
jgi:EmrB/QacA subfamily drug resistance transporter